MDEPCNESISETDQSTEETDCRQLTVYDIIRLRNCKTNQFRKTESYPNIRPPISKCCYRQTSEWLDAAAVEAGCEQGQGREEKYDLIEMWKQSPNKESLSCYGLGGNEQNPDAILFNRAVLKSLDKANGVEAKPSNKTKMSPAEKRKPKESSPMANCGPYVLNLNELQSLISRNPALVRQVSAKAANSVRDCPNTEDSANASEKDEPFFPLQVALDLAKPEPRRKRVVRRKHRKCKQKSELPENQCTKEWLRYKENPGPQDEEAIEEDEEVTCDMTPRQIEQPNNFDNLYGQLLACFEKAPNEFPDCGMYSKCCRRRNERQELQGCGEYELPLACNCGESDLSQSLHSM